MKVVMTLLVRNEEDIIQENLEYHLNNGVDFFIITDHLSNDATPDILARYVRYGIAEVIKYNDPIYPQAAWVTNMARAAATKHKADWVINSDADEFWHYTRGTLKDSFSVVNESVYSLHIKRFDFFCLPYKFGKFYESMLFRETSRRWTKCCHRAVDDINVEMGNHNALSDKFIAKSYTGFQCGEELKIYHYPVRNLQKYKQKIIDGNEALNNTHGLDPNSGFHWRMAMEHIKNGTYEQFMDCYMLSPEKINSGIRNGSLIFDDTIQKSLYKIS